MNNRFFLDQHGCAKNQLYGELLIGILTDNGWQKTIEPEKADLIIVNSCGFIEPAKKESIEAVITARMAYPQAKILLAGCLAERYGDIFKTEFEEADALFGNGDLSQLPILIDRLFPDAVVVQQRSTSALHHPAVQNSERYQPVQTTTHSRPFLKLLRDAIIAAHFVRYR